MINKPLFSIVTVVYNGEKCIEATINSCVQQSFDSKEYIIIDGLSNDGTIDIIDKYRGNINVFVSEPDGGIYHAMNKAISLAKGEYLIFMNCGDVFYDKEVLSNVNTFLKSSDESPDVLYGDTIFRYKSYSLKTPAGPLASIEREMVFCHQSAFVRTELLKEYRFDLNYKHSADYELLLRYFRLGYKFKHIELFISVFDQEGGNSLDNFIDSTKERFHIQNPVKKISKLLKFYLLIFRMGLGLKVRNLLPESVRLRVVKKKYKDRFFDLTPSIVFILPEFENYPIGGYKVVFEYANRFSIHGYQVTIVYPFFLSFSKTNVKRKVKMVIKYLYFSIISRNSKTTWFNLNKDVKELRIKNLSLRSLPSADYYVSTAMETAYSLNEIKSIKRENKFYLIQGIEDWKWGINAFLDTLKYDLNKIVVSGWLKEYLLKNGAESILIENGVDRPNLEMITHPKDRNKYVVMMLYHKQKLKGSDDGLKALVELKKKYPYLKSIWFGSFDKPSGLPAWIEYHKKPDEKTLNNLYNSSSVFMAPSHSEGFGLTVGEAMMCGCSVACTDAGGFLSMAINRETALISNVSDVSGMINNISEFIENDSLRINIALEANKYIQRFKWDNSFSIFKELLDKDIK